jgi:hypothetical protein
MNKLCTVDPSFLTNKQKLAFWLNIYNFCVMHVRQLIKISQFQKQNVKLSQLILISATKVTNELDNTWRNYKMHFQAFLQHGLPPSPDKLLALLNQASVNVGGTVVNVLSIEHLFLRHSPDQSNKQVTK